MKSSSILTCLLLMSTSFISCHKSNINSEKDFNNSYKTWLNFKDSSHNSYRYSVVGGTWIGFGWATTITVTDGKVTQRSYKLSIPPNGTAINIPAEEMEWTEDANELNTHTRYGAADPVTLDVIYDKARTEWLPKRKDAKTYFETKNNGMISSCGYVPNGCQDDCFIGINIAYIQAL